MATFTGKSIPLGQEKSLSLFDFLKITWIWQEQLFGVEIGVIGHWVNSTDLSVSLEKVKKQALIANLMRFSNHVSAPWVDGQHLTGLAKLGEGGWIYFHWAPLQSAWEKISGSLIRKSPCSSKKKPNRRLALASWSSLKLLRTADPESDTIGNKQARIYLLPWHMSSRY